MPADDPSELDPVTDIVGESFSTGDVRVRMVCRSCRAEVGAVRSLRGPSFVFWGRAVITPAIDSLDKAQHFGCGGDLAFRGLT